MLLDKEKLGVEDILLPRPTTISDAKELQLMIKTNSNFDSEKHGELLERLNKIFGEEAQIFIFIESYVKRTVEIKADIGGLYKDFLETAIPISLLREDISLADQWREQADRMSTPSKLLLIAKEHAMHATKSPVTGHQAVEQEKKTKTADFVI